MKADVLDLEGKKVKEIELPSCFSSEVREDIVQRVVEILKEKQPYAPFLRAGKQASASGNIRHSRRKWKTAYGKGISRVPRKVMWRRGDQFYWIGAEIASARKGRRAHPPKILAFLRKKKVNKKEMKLALRSAMNATAQLDYLKKRYGSVPPQVKLPLVVEGKIAGIKHREFKKALEKILGVFYTRALKEKSIRAGKGKLRGRRYKENAGLLMVIGDQERVAFHQIDVRKASSVKISDFAQGSLGRLTLYTEAAIQDLARRFGK